MFSGAAPPRPAARSANSLYALWDDPGFAPARNAMFDSFMSESRKSGGAKSQLTREEISEYTALLDNPLAIGFVSDPAKNPPPLPPSQELTLTSGTESFSFTIAPAKKRSSPRPFCGCAQLKKNPLP